MTEPAVAEFESVEGMPPPAAEALHHLLWALADTKLLLGYHYGEWTFGTPELEAAVASCSLSQAELGHVRLLHAILTKHWGERPDELIERRAPRDFANVAYLDGPLGDWPALVVTNAVVDLATTRVLYALRGSTFKPLRMSVEKMLDEERHHLHHGRGWYRTIGRAGGAPAERLRAATIRALAAVTIWLGPGDDAGDRALVESGAKGQSNFDVLAGLTADIADLVAEAGVARGPVPVSLAGWDPRTRRVPGAGGPADDIVFHLRGSANEIFKLGE
jgi:phenylacetate-CoA oxygenase PaaI subunit